VKNSRFIYLCVGVSSQVLSWEDCIWKDLCYHIGLVIMAISFIITSYFNYQNILIDVAISVE